MSFQLNLPPSAILRMAKDDAPEEGEEGTTNKREDWKKMKELEEMRKAGTAPAMKDEEGKDINPHIPQYIMQAPWYIGATTATLRHQRPQDEKHKPVAELGEWYMKGIKEGPVATKYRKGACENCGAMTHKKKDCLERPRRVGAKFTGSLIAPDEHLHQQLEFDYAGKRDRWNGYSLDEHKKIQLEFAKLEEAKRQLKAQRLESGVIEKRAKDSDEEEDEDKYADDVDMPGQKFESKQRITVRNLRIREDTAKYLYNLDVNSAYYDPKTRSMRENPYKNTGREEEQTFHGDNFVRWSGDAMKMAEKQIFAWEAYEKGAEVHVQADPTKLEMLAREYKHKKAKHEQSVKQNVLDKYGGEEHLDAPPQHMLMAQSEDYVEYSRHGSIIKGQEKVKVKSMYEEDVYINNHTSVWGSYWKEGKWGYNCCHSLMKESYCTGEDGKIAAQSSLPVPVQIENPTESAADEKSSPGKSESKTKKKSKKDSKKKRQRKKKRSKKGKKKLSESSSSSDSSSSSSSSSSSDSSSSDSESEDEEAAQEKRIKAAMAKEQQRVKEVDKMLQLDERKRSYNSMYTDKAPDEDEMEAFRRKRIRSDDPMGQFLGK